MATSSIFADIEIKDSRTAERFVAALEDSEKALAQNEQTAQAYPILKDLDRIRKLVAKGKGSK